MRERTRISPGSGAALPEEFKNSCYQICGEELSRPPLSAAQKTARKIERGFFHKAMNLFPPIGATLNWSSIHFMFGLALEL